MYQDTLDTHTSYRLLSVSFKCFSRCPLVGARSILVDAEIEEVAAEKRVVIKMNVFKFPSTNQVRLISNIRVCTSNNKDACTSLVRTIMCSSLFYKISAMHNDA